MVPKRLDNVSLISHRSSKHRSVNQFLNPRNQFTHTCYSSISFHLLPSPLNPNSPPLILHPHLHRPHPKHLPLQPLLLLLKPPYLPQQRPAIVAPRRHHAVPGARELRFLRREERGEEGERAEEDWDCGGGGKGRCGGSHFCDVASFVGGISVFY
jgi:hypothetical protein